MQEFLHFGVFEVDLKACELRKHGLRLKLPEQPFQVLVVLLENPGEIVTREELRNRLWPGDTFVDFDHGLNNAVMRLREVLGIPPRTLASSRRSLAAATVSLLRSQALSFPHPQRRLLDWRPGMFPSQLAATKTIDAAALETSSEPAGLQQQSSATRFAVLAAAVVVAAILLGAGLIYRSRVDANKAGRAKTSL